MTADEDPFGADEQIPDRPTHPCPKCHGPNTLSYYVSDFDPPAGNGVLWECCNCGWTFETESPGLNFRIARG